jgi:hypothetical protein
MTPNGPHLIAPWPFPGARLWAHHFWFSENKYSDFFPAALDFGVRLGKLLAIPLR